VGLFGASAGGLGRVALAAGLVAVAVRGYGVVCPVEVVEGVVVAGLFVVEVVAAGLSAEVADVFGVAGVGGGAEFAAPVGGEA
jgi:hypothetical protein